MLDDQGDVDGGVLPGESAPGGQDAGGNLGVVETGLDPGARAYEIQFNEAAADVIRGDRGAGHAAGQVPGRSGTAWARQRGYLIDPKLLWPQGLRPIVLSELLEEKGGPCLIDRQYERELERLDKELDELELQRSNRMQ